MRQHPRLGIALLITTYVALATALIDGTRTLNLEYLPINLSNQRPPQPRPRDMIHPRLDDLMESNSDRNGGFPDHLPSPELNIPSQRTEDLEELGLAFLADKLRGSVKDGLVTDHQRRPMLQDKDFEELMDGMLQAGESDTKSRLYRQAFDVRTPRDHLEMSPQLGEQVKHYLVNCRSGSLNWPPCALFNTPDTGPILHESQLQDIPNGEDFAEVGSDEDEDDQTSGDYGRVTSRSKRDTETADEISRSTRQAPQSHVLPSKMRKGFSAWGGKRIPPFGSWGGKRAPDFHSWGGKRAQGGLKSHKKQMSDPSAWEGKRVPAFHSWGGKRAPFNSWGGKRAPSFNSWGGKRVPSFNSWGGKRAPSFNSWGGKRATFNSWGGKRSLEFDSAEDKTMPVFTNWGGKRAPFNSWGGKRAFQNLHENSEDRLGQPLVISTDESQLLKVNEIEDGEHDLVSDGHWDGPWVSKWPWASPHIDKQKASELVTPSKPPEQ